jgi:Zn-dependent protease
MTFDSRPKDNPLNWSFRIGELFGITIRLHLFFIFGAIIILALAFKDAGENAGLNSVVESLGAIAILFLIVLVHEFGHCWGARRSGGEANEILLWPLGGLAMVQPRHNPWSNFVTTVSGPAVNVILCAVTAVTLVLLGGGIGAVPWNPMAAFSPVGDSLHYYTTLQSWLRIVFGLSYIVLLFNLMPVYPFDGGRLLHCYLWPRKGYREATMTATFVGMVGAILLGVAGLLTGGMLLLTIAVFGYITCYADRRAAKMAMLEGDQDGEFGYDFSQGHTSFDHAFEEQEKKPGYFERRRRAKEEARMKREAEALEQQRQRVDEILLKVHREGMRSLTAEETRILQKETERQRADGAER